MITGDHPATARAIAARLGIADDRREAITGPELSRLSPEALSERVGRLRVYARTSPEQKIANPTAIFSGLDKITGRIFPFEVAMDETVQFGALQVTPRACYTRPPTEPQNTTGFIEVEEITLDGKTRRIFNGWMFAASPGLNAVEHAIYDVWLVDCKQGPPDTSKASG